jgi:hypothetical protein
MMMITGKTFSQKFPKSAGAQFVGELILVNNCLLIKTVRFINRRQLSTAPVDGARKKNSVLGKPKYTQTLPKIVSEKKVLEENSLFQKLSHN